MAIGTVVVAGWRVASTGTPKKRRSDVIGSGTNKARLEDAGDRVMRESSTTGPRSTPKQSGGEGDGKGKTNTRARYLPVICMCRTEGSSEQFEFAIEYNFRLQLRVNNRLASIVQNGRDG